MPRSGFGPEMTSPISAPTHGRLAENILHFTRALRAAGIAVGTGHAIRAVEAIAAGGFTRRSDFYHMLAACLLTRPEQRAIFDQCFHIFWRDPQIMEKMLGLMLPEMRAPPHEHQPRPGEKRAAEALLDGSAAKPPEAVERAADQVEFDARLTLSEREQLRRRDFEQMSAAEISEARRAIARLQLSSRPILSRRMRASPHGTFADWRRTMRIAVRTGNMAELKMRKRRERPPALVALCDISGSMAGYSRMFLHFLHAAMNAERRTWQSVHVFTFATRLSNITRHLRARDVDKALALSGHSVGDWEGGTRIGEALRSFNRDWSRRVLGQGAIVLLITDGLERGDPELLSREAARLQRSCRKLIWLNPLLRFEGFEARAAGVRALLPHVDSLLSGHSLDSMDDLVRLLSSGDGAGEKARLMAGSHTA